jgi:hypothetical protein
MTFNGGFFFAVVVSMSLGRFAFCRLPSAAVALEEHEVCASHV